MQVFLQAKLLGVERFVQTRPGAPASLACRSLYISLLAEVLPRMLLEKLGLAKELLGFSGAGQFLVLLPEESVSPAGEFLAQCAGRVASFSDGALKLVWASTENLGDWSEVRRRIQEALRVRAHSALGADVFAPFDAPATSGEDPLAAWYGSLATASRVGYSESDPALIVLDGGDRQWTWRATSSAEADIPLAFHMALDDESQTPASLAALAARARGRQVWGVLRGDVDAFGARLRRTQSIEEYLQFAVSFQRFFAGELQVACSTEDYWRKVSILYSGGDDFAVYGAWDALIGLAREIQRYFQRNVEEYLKEFAGAEGKTISMAIAIAPAPDAPLAAVYEEAGRRLESAKSVGKDCIALFGRIVDWKQLAEAEEIEKSMTRLVDNFGCSPAFLGELADFYRETGSIAGVRIARSRAERFDRPWRFQRRLSRVLAPPAVRQREFAKARAELLGEFIGKKQAHVKLRPAGRVALEWARLKQATE